MKLKVVSSREPDERVGEVNDALQDFISNDSRKERVGEDAKKAGGKKSVLKN